MKVSVIGAGSWGCALARLLAINGNAVCVWSKDEREVQILKDNHEQTEKLPKVKLPESIEYTLDLAYAVKNAEVCVLAVPSAFIRSVAKDMSEYVNAEQIAFFRKASDV